MRVVAIVISVLCVAIPARGFARTKPKIAVAPLVDDPGNKVGQAIADALGKDYAVLGPRETGREMKRLGMADELDSRSARKLVRKLGVVAVIDGKVGKAGRKRTLHVEVHRRGKPDAGFTIDFKSAAAARFRRGVHDEIERKLEGAGDDPAGDDDEERASAPPPRVAADGERPRAADDGERPARATADEARPARKPAADDTADRRSRKSASEGRRGKRVASQRDGEAEDDGGAVTRRRGRGPSDDPAALPAIRVDAGGSVAQRQLSFDVRSGFTQVPPRVATTAGSGRIDGEIYPFALADRRSSLSGLGLAAAYDRTFGLSIKVPNQPVSAPISQSHYAIGARYRFGIGDGSLALGLDYARRSYVADRSGLMAAVLDAPDVDYAAIAPGAALRLPVAGSVAVFGSADALLVYDAGGIQKSASYGPATVYGFEGTAGVDIAITRQLGLRVALEYSQVNFTFTPKGPTLANNRDNDPATQDVNGATDRSIGGAVTLGLSY